MGNQRWRYIYLRIINKAKIKSMAFISNHINGNEKKQDIQNNQQPSSELDKAELEYLLRILGNADLKGKEVEMFYKLVIKLQQQYISKQ